MIFLLGTSLTWMTSIIMVRIMAMSPSSPIYFTLCGGTPFEISINGLHDIFHILY